VPQSEFMDALAYFGVAVVAAIWWCRHLDIHDA
jgi:hypothetical protein